KLPSRIVSRECSAAAIDSFLQFGAGDKLRHFLGRNFQRSAGLWIASGSRLARTHGKGSETYECYLAALLQRRYNTVDRGIQSVARLNFRNLRVFRDLVN